MKNTNREYIIVKLSDLLKKYDSPVEEIAEIGYNTSILCDLNLSFEKNVDDIFQDIKDLGFDYPNFYDWYHHKVIPDIRIKKR